MNNEKMVSVPRDEIEAACARFAKAQIFDFSRRMRALLDQPADQHQGDPVAYRFKWDYDHGNGWKRGAVRFVETLDEVAHEDQSTWREITKLYTRADPAEVERLRRLVDSKESERLQLLEECAAVVNALRTQLADALYGELWLLSDGEGFEVDNRFVTSQRRIDDNKVAFAEINYGHPDAGMGEPFQSEQIAAGEFIAAANPATVLALLAEIEQLEVVALAMNGAGVMELIAERDQLKADNERLQRVAQEEIDRADKKTRELAGALMLEHSLNSQIHQVKAENKELRKQAAIYQEIQRGAGVLPDGWIVSIEIERSAGSAVLLSPGGSEINYPSNHEALADSVSDAIDYAIEQSGENG